MAARALRGIISVTLLTATFASGVGVGQASSAPPDLVAAPGPIVTSGPLTKIETTTDLNCAVNHVADELGEFFGDTACGTFLVVDGELFCRPRSPRGSRAPPDAGLPDRRRRHRHVADPFRYTTTVSAGSTGVTVAQTDSYVLGQESFRTDVTVTNSGAARTVRLYRAADCFLADSDSGKGSVTAANGAVACVSTASNRVEQFLPLSPGSHYYEAQYNEVWARITDKLAFPDTCRCDEEIDNGAGLQWDISLAAGGTATRSNLITFSPNGSVPLETAKTVDDSSVTPGANVAYTITVSNPGTTSASLSTITDDLPAGFSYVPGSTTGTTTSEPSLAAGSCSGRWVTPSPPTARRCSPSTRPPARRLARTPTTPAASRSTCSLTRPATPRRSPSRPAPTPPRPAR